MFVVFTAWRIFQGVMLAGLCQCPERFHHGVDYQMSHRRRSHRAGGGTCPPNFWQQGYGGTTEFMGHLQLYEASLNFWEPNIRQHGRTLGQPNFARWPRVTGRPISFYRIHHAHESRHSEGPNGPKIVTMSVPSWNISRPLQHVPNVDFFHCGMPPLCRRNWGAQRKFGGTLKKISSASRRSLRPNFKTV